jgi:hypothetical protein
VRVRLRLVSVRSSKGVALLVVAVVAVACLSSGAGTAAARRALAPPKVGTWKVIAAENTGTGAIKATGGVIGSFRVTADKTVVG